ncbi:MAG: hypothetical protein ABIH56_05350 [Candidatus Margulisiibacteriota bacterium]
MLIPSGYNITMVKVGSEPPKTSILKLPVRSQKAIYKPVEHIVPPNHEYASFLIRLLGRYTNGPSQIDWGTISPYKGAIYAAIDQADGTGSIKNSCNNLLSESVTPLTWGGLLVKVGFSFYAMLGQVNLPLVGISLGVPTEFHMAFTYLSLNAARNLAADLVAKHGLSPRECWANKKHIKWEKLMDSLVVTSTAYLFLSSLKDYLHGQLGSSPLEWAFTPMAITLADGTYNWLTRKYRGFNGKVAFYDFFRPAIGDVGATLSLWLTTQDLKSGFVYLLIRKVFCELWSGHWESRDKRLEKIAHRVQDFENIFDYVKYKVPDPAALAAINLVFVMRHKTMARRAFIENYAPQLMGGDELAKKHFFSAQQALMDDQRIEKAIQFIFPRSTWESSRAAMRCQFAENRREYLEWLKSEEPMFFMAEIEKLK